MQGPRQDVCRPKSQKELGLPCQEEAECQQLGDKKVMHQMRTETERKDVVADQPHLDQTRLAWGKERKDSSGGYMAGVLTHVKLDL